MTNEEELEKYYKKFSSNLNEWLPDGLIEIDINMLERFDLLHYPHSHQNDSALTHCFQAIESKEKLVLMNNQYVIWIVPSQDPLNPVTHTFIAIQKNNDIFLQLGFINRGIYNNSQLILRLLEHFLVDIQELEETVRKFG